MIPKIIHMCWLSGDAFPKDIANCLHSWKEILPDYEIWLWGKKPEDCQGLNIIEKPFDLNSVVWCKQAFEAKKYAFAADYIRVYAVYNYGGIYMDSDVMMYKSFNDLLDLPYFIGEDFVHCFEPAIFGAEKGCEWVKTIWESYADKKFVKEDSSLDMQTLPMIFLHTLSKNYRFRYTKGKRQFKEELGWINLFPSSWFNSRNYVTAIKTKESYCSHQFLGSWLKESNASKWKKYIPMSLMNIAYWFMYNVRYRQETKSKGIKYENL